MKAKKAMVSALLCILGIVFCVLPLWAGGDQEAGGGDGPITVQFWTAPNQGQFDFWNDKVASFNEAGITLEGRAIQVEIQMMPESPSSEAGIQNALATDTAPAASANINRGFAATLAASGRVYTLEESPAFKDIVAARKMEEVLPGWAIDGKQYVIPLYANAMGYHWNVRALKALGFTDHPPQTLAEMKSLIDTFFSLRDSTMKEIGVDHLYMRPQLMHPEWWWDRWFDFQMQYEAFSGGGNWVEGNRLSLDKETCKEVFEFFGSFGSSLQTAEDWTAFEKEDVPVVFQVTAPWDIPKYEAAGKKYGFDGDYVYGPAIVKEEGDIPYTFADSKGIVFYKGGNISELDHQAIVKFIHWCFTGEQGEKTDYEWVKTAGMLPVRGDLLENSAFAELIASNPAYAYQAEVMPYAIPAMAHDRMVDIQTALGEKGLTPYIRESVQMDSSNAPDGSKHVEAAFSAMRDQGGLE